jgi:hypothetical protein
MANRFIGGVATSKAKSGTSISRASTGTYFDSSGVLQTAPANQPRLNHSFVGSAWTQPAVLIEPERTNLNPYSQDFGSPNWGAVSSTITPNSTTAPDGTTTASLWALNSGSGEHYLSRSTTLIEGQLTYSVFAKPAGRNWIILNHNNSTGATYTYFNISTGTIGTTGPGVTPSIINVGNGWYRCVVTINHSAAAHGTNGPQLYIANDTGTASSFTGDGVSGVYIWGVQLEQGYGVTSYIPTAGTAVTRAADVVAPTVQPLMSLGDHYNLSSTDSAYKIDTYTLVDTDYTWTAPDGVEEVEVLVVAGGGGGGCHTGNDKGGGGGGAGGLIYSTSYSVTPGKTYPIVVGDGGAGGVAGSSLPAPNGENSQFGSLIAVGGGGGGAGIGGGPWHGASGGSGGGGVADGVGSNGNPGRAIATQGYPSSNNTATNNSAGGGGAGGPGIGNTSSTGGNGGPGLYFNISGTSVAYAGGGGGGAYSSTSGTGGVGGGGNAGAVGGNPGVSGIDGTGGGGGGAGGNAGYGSSTGGSGGSGIVIVKYRRKSTQAVATTTDAIVTQKFTTTNTWTVPAGVTQVEVLVVGGGGGAGGGEAYTGAGGGGGAGGVVYSSMYSVTPNGNCSIVVGAGGTGGTANNGVGDGTNGSNSVFAPPAANIVTNGSFDTDTGWAHTLTSIANGYMYLNAGAQPRPTNTSLTASTGSYLLTWTIVSNPGGHSANIDDDGAGAGVGSVTTYISGISAVGTYSLVVSKTASTRLRILGNGTFTSSMVFDNVFMYPVSSTINAIGGGAGGRYSVSGYSGGSGGGGGNSSAGGGSASQSASSSGGFGNAGAVGATYSSGDFTRRGGGGGGAGSAGIASGAGFGGFGGAGIPFSITGNLEYYAGGGGGGYAPNAGGIGGGGTFIANGSNGSNGAPNSGGGGGGAGSNNNASIGGNGGSGVVILRYRVPAVAEFKDSGTWTCPAGVTSVQALVLAGGGGGGAGAAGSQLGGGGAGAGGLIYSTSIPVTPGVTYPIIVGSGGVGGITASNAGTQGGNSSFNNLIAIGGGYGGVRSITETGGSGGSGGAAAGNPALGGTATYGQGNNGAGSQNGGFGGGGGGAGSVGVVGQAVTEPTGGVGGVGLQFSISGTATYYAGGGSSGAWGGDQIVPASLGGGGAGGAVRTSGYSGTQNTGGGGGGGGSGYRNVSADTAATGNGGNGGSGIVIIRWFEN